MVQQTKDGTHLINSQNTLINFYVSFVRHLALLVLMPFRPQAAQKQNQCERTIGFQTQNLYCMGINREAKYIVRISFHVLEISDKSGPQRSDTRTVYFTVLYCEYNHSQSYLSYNSYEYLCSLNQGVYLQICGMQYKIMIVS